MSDAVLHEKRGHEFRITINRPHRYNAIDDEVVAGLAEGWRLAEADREVRAIVLTGAGTKAFCAGADLKSGRAFEFDFSKPSNVHSDLIRQVLDSPLPSVARINGTCVGGGVAFTALCDMAVAADHAQFALPEVKIGLFPTLMLSLVQTLVPRRALTEWAVTGEPFDAQAALAAGLVNYVVPAAELDAKVAWLLSRITDKSPTAIRRGKYVMRAIASMPIEESLAYTETQMGTIALTEDAKEGMAAFIEKRRPRWSGR
jgi:enoyl-CoA hydratase/carnithine racemase